MCYYIRGKRLKTLASEKIEKFRHQQFPKNYTRVICWGQLPRRRVDFLANSLRSNLPGGQFSQGQSFTGRQFVAGQFSGKQLNWGRSSRRQSVGGEFSLYRQFQLKKTILPYVFYKTISSYVSLYDKFVLRFLETCIKIVKFEFEIKQQMKSTFWEKRLLRLKTPLKQVLIMKDNED